MTTKPPSQVQEFASTSIEKIAYTSVSTIETVEMNDRNRLGFHVWRWLTTHEGTLEQAIAESGARLKISQANALEIIKTSLKNSGVAIE